MFDTFFNNLYTRFILDDQLLQAAKYFREGTEETNQLAEALIKRFPEIINLPNLAGRTLLYTIATKYKFSRKIEPCIILLRQNADPNIVIRYDENSTFTILDVCFTNPSPKAPCIARLLVSYGMHYFTEEETSSESSEEDSCDSTAIERVPLGEAGQNIMEMPGVGLCFKFYELEREIKNNSEFGCVSTVGHNVDDALILLTKIIELENKTIEDPDILPLIVGDYTRRGEELKGLIPTQEESEISCLISTT